MSTVRIRVDTDLVSDLEDAVSYFLAANPEFTAGYFDDPGQRAEMVRQFDSLTAFGKRLAVIRSREEL